MILAAQTLDNGTHVPDPDKDKTPENNKNDRPDHRLAELAIAKRDLLEQILLQDGPQSRLRSPFVEFPWAKGYANPCTREFQFRLKQDINMRRQEHLWLKRCLPICAGFLSVLFFAVHVWGQEDKEYGIGTRTWRTDFDCLVVAVLAPAEGNIASEKIALRPDIKWSKEPPTVFRVLKVLKGKDHLQVGQFVAVVPSEKPDKIHLPHAWLAQYKVQLDKKTWWTDAMPITATGEAYAEMVLTDMTLAKRVQQYLQFWNADDEVVRKDLMRELYRLEIEDLLPLHVQLDHDLMVQRAQNRKLNPRQRELAFKMLAIVVIPKDKQWLRAFIDNPDEESGSAGAACTFWALFDYLAVAGEDGLQWLEKGILKDPDSPWYDVALGALSHHAQCDHYISRDRAIKALHAGFSVPEPPFLLLIVLSDLGDWSSLDQMTQTGLEAAKKVGEPEYQQRYEQVLEYLANCPKSAAKACLAKMRDAAPKAYDEWEQQRKIREMD